MFATSFGFDSGINEIKIQCIKPMADVIGITSDITECKSHDLWVNDTKQGKFYSYYNQCGIDQNVDGVFERQYDVNFSIKWKKDDIIELRVDCDEWNVSFHLNDTLIGGKVPIAENLRYHLVICTNSEACAEYQLLL